MKWVIRKEITLLDSLKEKFPSSSNNERKRWIREGRLKVQGKKASLPSDLLAEGDTLELLPKTKRLHTPVKIVFQDPHLVVIDKPEGMLSVKTPYDRGKSAHEHLKELHKGTNVLPVHRLDRETSGLLVFALTREAAEGLKEQFAAHTTKREYNALVEGRVKQDEGTWDFPLKEGKNFFMHIARPGQEGLRAVTHFKVLRRTKRHTLLELQLETGKKNQIRVHASHVGHPVDGDKKYGAEGNATGRLALHARSLGFIHPITQKEQLFHSPTPKRFTDVN